MALQEAMKVNYIRPSSRPVTLEPDQLVSASEWVIDDEVIGGQGVKEEMEEDDIEEETIDTIFTPYHYSVWDTMW